ARGRPRRLVRTVRRLRPRPAPLHRPGVGGRSVRYRLLALLLVAAIAAGAVTAHGDKARGVGVSSALGTPLPYVAPWDIGFKRYSTLIVPLTGVTTSIRAVTVPDGQWWRIVLATVPFKTKAVVADRI